MACKLPAIKIYKWLIFKSEKFSNLGLFRFSTVKKFTGFDS
jgi:hypothetical protein